MVTLPLFAQPALVVRLPDVSITADRVLRGDADTYGSGDWYCTFQLTLEGPVAVLEGYIAFHEKANDSTVIVGRVRRCIALPEQEPYPWCALEAELNNGIVRGPNIGARGPRWYAGRGLIRRAYIVTDTFGNDAGRIGGRVQFRPVVVRLRCAYAGLYFTQ
jgi:hypothetical protein